MANDDVTLFLAGDVMTGRGLDQLLPNPSAPALREAWVGDARVYIELAENVSGPIARPVPPAWIWGEALEVLDELAPDARIVNLETSITTSDDYWPDKGIHYRMHPRSVACLTSARLDACALGNNHVLDFGHAGLLETLDTLTNAGLRPVGAGRHVEQAESPVRLPLRGGTTVVLYSFASPSSGVPEAWAATRTRPGVAWLPDLQAHTAERVGSRVQAARMAGDVVVVSLHWGGNWGYEVPDAQRDFARALVEAGVDVVFGHSSHHPKGVELYRQRLILYGCGDLINDYEGIGGHVGFRSDLRPMYFPTLDRTGALQRLRIVLMQSRGLRLVRVSAEDARWLEQTLSGLSTPNLVEFV